MPNTRSPGVRGTRFADASQEALTGTIPKAMQRAAVPGAIVGVWQDDAAPFARAFGMRDTAGQPMATHLLMRIGSVSKTFTTTAVLQLVDQGKVGLDDPISRFVSDVPNGDNITIRQLAAMRSGLYDYSEVVVPGVPSQPHRQGRQRNCSRSVSAVHRSLRQAPSSTTAIPTLCCWVS